MKCHLKLELISTPTPREIIRRSGKVFSPQARSEKSHTRSPSPPSLPPGLMEINSLKGFHATRKPFFLKLSRGAQSENYDNEM